MGGGEGIERFQLVRRLEKLLLIVLAVNIAQVRGEVAQ
jgi:hypothetical protein